MATILSHQVLQLKIMMTHSQILSLELNEMGLLLMFVLLSPQFILFPQQCHMKNIKPNKYSVQEGADGNAS